MAEVSLVDWKKSQQTTDIRGRILQGYMKGAAENCAYVGTVAEVVNFCGRQAVHLRGHDEGIRSDNRGNFLEILEIIARHDPIVKSRLDHGCRYYTSPAIQNELLQIQAELIHGDICSEVREARFYSVMADESRDLSKHEQISITLRYFREGRIHDCFLCFARVENLTAESLSQDILRAIERGGVNLDGLVAQSYDGANVMAGNMHGVQARLLEKTQGRALFLHCSAHWLNLASFRPLHNLGLLYGFLATSVVHFMYEQLRGNNNRLELQRLSDTRWVCQHAACYSARSNLLIIVDVLEHFAQCSSRGLCQASYSSGPSDFHRYLLCCRTLHYGGVGTP